LNIEVKIKREKRNFAVRWLIYGIMTAAAYVIMTTVRTPLSTPLLLLPLSLCIAMFEEPFNAAVTGLASGMLLDAAIGSLIGFNGVLLLWCCLFTSLLFMFVMRRHILNIVLLTASVTFIQGFLHYLFYFSIWGYNTGGDIFVGEFLPVIIFTNAFTFIYYFIVKFLVNRLGVIKEGYVEEKTEDKVRE
jgi:cell shape-determining protein MreD